MSVIKCIASNRSFGGWHKRFTHLSSSNACEMTFAVYLPDQTEQKKLPVLYWLSGLTCTDENFMQKSAVQRWAAELGIIVVAPDTSPRGESVANDEGYDLGQGAGFYVNATQQPWEKHYQMYAYIVDELPTLIEANFPATQQRGISGHSMGGHGALSIALKSPGRYSSVSAFSPIVNPIQCSWGQKALRTYLGDDCSTWVDYDSCELMNLAKDFVPMLIDQGSEDDFLAEQLLTDNLAAVVKQKNYPATIRMQEGYDHSYYFVASFIEEHLRFHAEHFS